MNEVITSEVNFIISITEKCKYHQSIKVIKTHMEKKDKPNFRFNEITKSIVVKEIKKLNPRKTSLSNNISKKLIKEFCHINILLLTILANAWITTPFQKVSKYWRQYQFIKKTKQLTKTFVDWKVCYLIFPNLMKHIYMMSWMHTFTMFFQNFNAAFAKVIGQIIVCHADPNLSTANQTTSLKNLLLKGRTCPV